MIVANQIAPGLIDRYLARNAYAGQASAETVSPSRRDNLFATVRGSHAVRGRFDDEASRNVPVAPDWLWRTVLPASALAAAALVGLVAGLTLA